MRIFDENGIAIESPDMDKGYLKDDSLFICHHEDVAAVEEQGHWEIVREYPNGGKDVEWIIDVPSVEAQESWDEYESILRYVLYTEEELAEIEEARKRSADYRVIELEAMLNALLGVTE